MRRYSFMLVDRVAAATGIVQLTEADLCLLRKLDTGASDTTRIGAQYRLWRSAPRQPASAEYLGFTDSLIAVSIETVQAEILRIHGVQCTEADVRTGGFSQLVALRINEVLHGKRVLAS